ncbi:CopY/TcrY family copper transport repressor [Lacticaseibacillus manihotivorans]|jgi:CopY/TcrY family copper transport repressor|uniref:Transcriptional regulator n=2 Tax=Lacticaseibacillus manihotivorans TaxID=88233 RepID=A0A0R1RGB1_9LACO|nr:CopY/TcrY family copper transport repressor [Lacticaseibacillus manihotivorans]KRL52424.1 transcriptional regulator [Lacticaseibacillus manihotivorans DSM 13343 = JCM 12514]QFQ90592.1 CopY/TcrY family copper transport repressor [Lacticaseibacillus manihotivorans]
MASIEMSPAEWNVMRVIWTKSQADTTTIIQALQAKRDWSQSTIKTLLRRLVEKQALTTTKVGRQFMYHPEISEQHAMQKSANTLFDSLCDMKKGAILTNLLESSPLSRSDIERMQKVLAEKAQTAPEQVACNCLADNCECEKEVQA